jgi:hypothetical protein
MASEYPTPRKLWQHPDPKSTAMWKFMQKANTERGLNMQVSLSSIFAFAFVFAFAMVLHVLVGVSLVYGHTVTTSWVKLVLGAGNSPSTPLLKTEMAQETL